jgi:hypothetical protein
MNPVEACCLEYAYSELTSHRHERATGQRHERSLPFGAAQPRPEEGERVGLRPLGVEDVMDRSSAFPEVELNVERTPATSWHRRSGERALIGKGDEARISASKQLASTRRRSTQAVGLASTRATYATPSSLRPRAALDAAEWDVRRTTSGYSKRTTAQEQRHANFDERGTTPSAGTATHPPQLVGAALRPPPPPPSRPLPSRRSMLRPNPGQDGAKRPLSESR